MPKLYMLVGLPASGKSSWVEKQNFDDSVLIASTDKHIVEYAESFDEKKTYNEVFAEYYNTAKILMEAEIKEAIMKGQDIVWDQTNLTKNSRAVKLSTIPSNYIKVAVVLSCLSEKEHKTRLKSRIGKIISQRTISQMKQSYEPPEIIEGFDVISYNYN